MVKKCFWEGVFLPWYTEKLASVFLLEHENATPKLVALNFSFKNYIEGVIFSYCSKFETGSLVVPNHTLVNYVSVLEIDLVGK